MNAVGWMVARMGAAPVYFLMDFAIPFYIIFGGKGRRAIWRFYRKHLKYGFLRSAMQVFRCYHCFGKVVVDKFAFYAGATGKYVLEGGEDQPKSEIFSSAFGSVIASAHIGNFESLGALLRQDVKQMYCLVFAGERKDVLESRTRAMQGTHVNLIPVGDGMDYLFSMYSALSSGGVLLLTADRAVGSGRTVRCRFLGKDAYISAGPFEIAARMKVPLYTAFAMMTGYCRYRLYMEKIDFPQHAADKTETVRMMAEQYCSRLEDMVRKYPEQWFNFYDFWNET